MTPNNALQPTATALPVLRTMISRFIFLGFCSPPPRSSWLWLSLDVRRQSIMRLFLLLVLPFILSGCRTSAPSPSAHLSRDQALSIAVQAAAKRNVESQKYRQPEIIFYSGSDSRPGKWDVFWRPKSDSDEAFVVIINDKTGRVAFAKQVINPPTVTPAPPPNNALQPTATAPPVLTEP